MINLNIEYTLFRIQISAEVCLGFTFPTLEGFTFRLGWLLGMCLWYNTHVSNASSGVEVEHMAVEQEMVGSNPAWTAQVRKMFFEFFWCSNEKKSQILAIMTPKC